MLSLSLGIQVGQGLVHEQDFGFNHEHSGHRDSLLLAAAEFARVPAFQSFELYTPED